MGTDFSIKYSILSLISVTLFPIIRIIFKYLLFYVANNTQLSPKSLTSYFKKLVYDKYLKFSLIDRKKVISLYIERNFHS